VDCILPLAPGGFIYRELRCSMSMYNELERTGKTIIKIFKILIKPVP
jgi:hypothetical protein